MVENIVNNYQIEENNVTENQINNFPKTTKFLEKLKNEDKKNIVEQVLGTGELKKLFENDSQYRKKCCEELKNCEIDEKKIQSIILANLPEGYVYDVLTGDIVRIEIENSGFVGADVVDKKKEQTEEKKEQADKDIEQADKDIEQAEEKKEQLEIDTEQLETDTEQLETDIEQKNNNAEKIKAKLEIAKDARNALIQDRPELDNVTKEGSDLYEQCKINLERNGTINQLKNSGLDDAAVRDYIILNATFREIKHNDNYEDLRKGSEFTSFYIALKQLNNACNIPDTTLNSFSEGNIRNTRTELFYDKIGNKGLIEQKQKNKESHSNEYNELFDVKDDKELIGKYGKFLSGSWAQFYKNWQNNTISEKDYKDLLNRVVYEKHDIEDKTKNLTEELCMTAQIKGILSCIPKDYSTNFKFNKANEISMDEGIFQLDGHVNGVDFSLRQNLEKEDGCLQTFTGLFRGTDEFNLSGVYKNSPFVLPTSHKVFETAITSIKSDELSNITNKNDYFRLLEKLILKDIDKLYVGTEYTHNYVDNQIKSELILDDTKKILSNFGVLNSKLGKLNGKCYDFFDTLDHNLENMTLREKEKFHDCMIKLGDIISEGFNIEGDNLAKDENFAKFLGSKQDTINTMAGKGGLDGSTLCFFDFFNFFLLNSNERNDNESPCRKILNLGELSKFINFPKDNDGYVLARGKLEDYEKKNFKDEKYISKIQDCYEEEK